MLTYLISVTEDLIATAVLVGLALACARVAWDRVAVRILAGGIMAGAVASVWMAMMKQTTNRIDTGSWNLVIFGSALVAFVVYLLLAAHPIKRVVGLAGQRARVVALAVFVAARLFYKLPDVYLYPLNFNLSDGTVLSTDFLYRLVGWACALVLVVLVAVALERCLRDAPAPVVAIPLALVMAVLALTQAMQGVQTMLARRMIVQSHELFLVAKFFSNSANLFIFVVMALAVAPCAAVMRASVTQREPYANPAEHRKIRARWRNRRRWVACAVCLLSFALVTVTALATYNSRGPELSPSEECEVRDGACYVALDQVDDGHLHRFTYELPSGVGVRFIVIRKPNSSAYGVGLDACDICGETGYYERGEGQVVCKLCDVVMNVNTIGFKGGCNPIVIDYTVEGGHIVIPTDQLADYEKTFRG